MPTIVYDYPKDIMAFYMHLNDDEKTVAAMDVLVPGIGELIGEGQREMRLKVSGPAPCAPPHVYALQSGAPTVHFGASATPSLRREVLLSCASLFGQRERLFACSFLLRWPPASGPSQLAVRLCTQRGICDW